MTEIEHSEGPVARPIEEQTVKLPSDVFLWAAGASIAASLILKMLDRHHETLPVGEPSSSGTIRFQYLHRSVWWRVAKDKCELTLPFPGLGRREVCKKFYGIDSHLNRRERIR